jgi:polar amino acid transport system substrate-binding protein
MQRSGLIAVHSTLGPAACANWRQKGEAMSYMGEGRRPRRRVRSASRGVDRRLLVRRGRCFSVLFVLAAGLLLLGACGNGGGTSDSSASPSASKIEIAGKVVTADAAIHDMLPDAMKSGGVVRVACDVPYPPWQMYEKIGTDKLTGIEIEMGNALAAKMGVQFVWQNSIFDSIIPALQADKADAVMATMWDTREREKVLDFVDWAKDGVVLVVKKGNPGGVTGLDDLAGRTVATQSGTMNVGKLQELSKKLVAAGKSGLQVLQFSKDPEALLALKSGKVEVEVTSGPAAAYLVQTPEGAAFEIVADPAAPYWPGLVGVGVLKKNAQLRDAIKAAFGALMTDGTYGAILDKYKAREVLGVDEIKVNAPTM